MTRSCSARVPGTKPGYEIAFVEGFFFFESAFISRNDSFVEGKKRHDIQLEQAGFRLKFRGGGESTRVGFEGGRRPGSTRHK